MFRVIEEKPPQWLLDDIQKGNDKLKNNYTLKNLRLQDMLTFNLVMYEDDIVAFSGLQNWYDGTARVNSRYYVTPKYRQYSLREKRVRYLWKYLMPYQIKVAEEIGFKKLFWSTELYRRRGKTMELTIQQAKKHLPKGWYFNRLEGLYQIKNAKQEVCQILKS
tara:strand:+ start:424 stop:912 length:489 start_codon:yes stop_codon:yes gene_type:complete